MNGPDDRSRSRRGPILVGVTLLAATVIAVLIVNGFAGRSTRQAVVAARGADVMPFDVSRTTHIFEPLVDGGMQSVVADDPTDVEQIPLIREHLRVEAAKFRRGDFGDPAAIHGDAMPGLDALRAGFSRIDVAYGDLPDGARIRYTTADPDMVTALARWFEAQLGDHGSDATGASSD